jgi:hypothetical protein
MRHLLARVCLLLLLPLAACSTPTAGVGEPTPDPDGEGGAAGSAQGAGGRPGGTGGSRAGGSGGKDGAGGASSSLDAAPEPQPEDAGDLPDDVAPPIADAGVSDSGGSAAPDGAAAMGNRVALMDQLTKAWVKERESIVMEGDTQVFKGVFKAGEIGGPRGHTPRLTLEPGKEYLLEYSVRFDTGWDFSRGGKLPGLAGATAPTGCVGTDGSGFSARLMWREQGRLIGYMYDIDKTEACGTPLNTTFHFKVNQWHKVKQRVKLNTGRNRDGEVQIWIDGAEQVNAKRPLMAEAANRRIDVVLFHSFFGGSTNDWAPSRDVTISFSEIYATLLAK